MSCNGPGSEGKARRVIAFAVVWFAVGLATVSFGALGQGCPPCGTGTDMIIYVGSDPNETYIAGTPTKATEVTGGILQDWTTISTAASCKAKWLWTNASGTPAYVGESVTFINGFTIPAGYTVTSACLEISADDAATVALNHKEIASHSDGNGYPSGGPSGWDEVSIVNVPVSSFQTGVNDLRVTVTDVHGINVGGIWCLRVCLSKDVAAACKVCPPGTTSTKYVGSNPVDTFIENTTAKAKEVTSSIVQYWSKIGSAAQCGAKWVSMDSSGDTSYGTAATFTNQFTIPAGSSVVYACLEISADDQARVILNGQGVGYHKDTNNLPSGGPSGWDEVSVFEVPVGYFQSGTNKLQVAVSDTKGSYIGAIWCLKICLKGSPPPQCSCGPGHVYLEPDVGVGGLFSGQVFNAESGSAVHVVLKDACAPPDCVKSAVWVLRDQQTQQILVQDAFDCSAGSCYATFIMPDSAVKFEVPTYSCGSAVCEGSHFFISPCRCGYWTHGVIESDSGKIPIPSQCGAGGCLVQVPYQSGELCIHTKYICTMQCQGGGVEPPEAYLWEVRSAIGSQLVAQGVSPVECRFCFGTVDLDGNGSSDNLIVEIVPVCGGQECDKVKITIMFMKP
jgi:hypothetical protein